MGNPAAHATMLASSRLTLSYHFQMSSQLPEYGLPSNAACSLHRADLYHARAASVPGQSANMSGVGHAAVHGSRPASRLLAQTL